MKAIERVGDRMLRSLLPNVTAKACGWYYFGTCYTGSGTYRVTCDQYWNSCDGADKYSIFDPWGNYVGTYNGVCSCF